MCTPTKKTPRLWRPGRIGHVDRSREAIRRSEHNLPVRRDKRTARPGGRGSREPLCGSDQRAAARSGGAEPGCRGATRARHAGHRTAREALANNQATYAARAFPTEPAVTMPENRYLTPAPPTVPRRSHEQEYGGIEYGGLPVKYAVLHCSPTVIAVYSRFSCRVSDNDDNLSGQ